MPKRSKQLNDEIVSALVHGLGHDRATVRDWQNLISELHRHDHYAFTTYDAQRRSAIAQELMAAQAGLKAARAADKDAKSTRPTNVTVTNLAALKAIVVQYRGAEFPKGYHAANKHIKRCIAGGLVELIDSKGEVTNKIFQGKKLRLTPTGREMVSDLIISDIAHRGLDTAATHHRARPIRGRTRARGVQGRCGTLGGDPAARGHACEPTPVSELT